VEAEQILKLQHLCYQTEAELFTGYLSENSLRLCRRLGYPRFREEVVSPQPRPVYLQKPGTGANRP